MRRISRGLHGLEGMTGAAADIARSQLARRYADSRFRQGRVDDAFHWAQLAARYAEESVDKATLAAAYEVLNHVYAGSGREEPFPYGRLALQAYTELGDLRHQGWCLNNLAAQDVTAGRWNESLADFRRAADLFRRIGDTAAEGNAALQPGRDPGAPASVRRGAGPAARTSSGSRARWRTRSSSPWPSVSRPARSPDPVLSTRRVALLRDARARFEALGRVRRGREHGPRAGRAPPGRRTVTAGRRRPGPRRRRAPERDPPEAGRPRSRARRTARTHARSAFDTGLELAERDGDLLEQALVLAELARLTDSRARTTPDDARRRRSPRWAWSRRG